MREDSMRNSLLVTGLAMILSFSAAQATDCSKVIEIPLAASAEVDQGSLDCLGSILQRANALNLELVAAAYDRATPAVYVLRFSPSHHIVSIDKMGASEVGYNLEHFDDESQRSEVISHGSPFYEKAAAAHDDLLSMKDGKRPASVTELVQKVAASAVELNFASRWLGSQKMAVKAEGK